jgi:glycosyltransferase involved in cell wall biosynthesis
VRSDVFAGVERYVATVARALAERGHDVTVVGGNGERVREVVGALPVRIARARTTPEVAYDLLRWSRDADVVHVHMTAAEAAAVLARPVVRAPVIATRHFASARGSSTLGRVVSPLIERTLRAELSISDYVAASAERPTRVVRSGVPRADAVDPVAPVVLVVQRLEPEKRTEQAIDIWAASDLADSGWTLRIAGDGAEAGVLRAAIARRNVGGVELLGDRDDVPELMQHSGMLLATTPREAFGLSAVEAMARALPVVASGSGGHRETVGAATPEMLYPPDDVEAGARLLRELAGDASRRRAVGAIQRAHQREHLDLDRHVDTLVEIYRSLLEPAGARVA